MSVDIDTPSTADSGSQFQTHNVLDTVDGEIYFFKSLMRARPVGVHRHFHVITMQAAIEKALKQSVPIDDIWAKLESCYNLDALEALVRSLLCFFLACNEYYYLEIAHMCFYFLFGMKRKQSMRVMGVLQIH